MEAQVQCHNPDPHYHHYQTKVTCYKAIDVYYNKIYIMYGKSNLSNIPHMSSSYSTPVNDSTTFDSTNPGDDAAINLDKATATSSFYPSIIVFSILFFLLKSAGMEKGKKAEAKFVFSKRVKSDIMSSYTNFLVALPSSFFGASI